MTRSATQETPFDLRAAGSKGVRKGGGGLPSDSPQLVLTGSLSVPDLGDGRQGGRRAGVQSRGRGGEGPTWVGLSAEGRAQPQGCLEAGAPEGAQWA